MFTGIIIGVGEVKSWVRSKGKLTVIPPPKLFLSPGGSIAVNGVCLTAGEVSKGGFTADLSPETLERTTLGSLRPGDKVNLELPVAADGRLDGHLVLGHVDALGEIISINQQGSFYIFGFRVGAQFDHLLVEKGSVAVDGISLTAFHVEGGRFQVAIIPRTYELTNLRYQRPGNRVNVEFDLLGKYVAKLLREGPWTSTPQKR